jgi:4-amino-4-deoxy-L-arabinose transferase-like glycosyltransferase
VEAEETGGHGVDRGSRLSMWAGLALVIALAASLRLWRLDQNGYGSPYYAAAVRSMLKGPSNFLFIAFDPVGFLAVDKPPVAFWVQAASASVFGYRGLSLLVPQALMGAGSVLLTYHLTARAFGTGAGWLAGLFLAITPICVAVDRSNVPDPALILVLLLAAWALLVAVESARTWPLLLSAALVGVGYNVKMLAAFLVLPAFILVEVLTLPVGVSRRLKGLAASAAVVAAVSLSWSLVVEVTPVTRRPYVGGSRTNSALDLALGYNGLERIFWRTGRAPSRDGGFAPWEAVANLAGGAASTAAPGEWAGFDGTPGPLRFAGPVMAGQMTWLVPLALVGTLAIAARLPWRRPAAAATILWIVWLGTHWVVFSLARGVLHEHYTAVMGPPVAALAGAGAIALRDGWRRGGWRAVLLPLAVVLTLVWQVVVLGRFPAWQRWLLPVMLAVAGLGMMGLIGTRLSSARPSAPAGGKGWEGFAYGMVILSLLVAPGAWSLIPVMDPGDSILPLADPSVLAGPPEGMPRPGRPAFDLDARGTRKLADFLVANRHGEPIAMASMEIFLAAPLIIEADLPAIALGGFSGSDRIVNAGQLAQMVRQGQLRFVLIVPGQGRANAELVDWIRRNGRPLDPDLWQTAEAEAEVLPASRGAPAMFALARQATTLYDLRPESAPIVPAARR